MRPLQHSFTFVFTCAILIVVPISGVAQESRLAVLRDKTEALQVRVDLIQRAEHSIDLAYYAIDTDEVPVAIMELLRRASMRGVRVRMLVDGLKSRVPSKFEHYLRGFGVDVRVYHAPHQGNVRWLNRRLHSKLIVADGAMAVIGSRNLENEYYNMDNKRSFMDCDAFVAGDVAHKAQAYFDWLWNTPDVQPAPDHDSFSMDVINSRPRGRDAWEEAWRDAASPSDFQSLLCLAVKRVVCQTGVQLDSQCDWIGKAEPGIKICLLHDCTSDKSEDRVQRGIVGMIDRARCHLLIESPYPAFDRPVRQAISRARARDVRVTILTNSLNSTDQLNVYAAYQNQKRGLLREGVQLREYCGDDILHAKTMIADNSCWMLGSYNFDARSDNLNLELCLISNDPKGAIQVRNSIQSRLQKSRAIKRGRLLLPVGSGASWHKRVRLIVKRSLVEIYRGWL
ncbi:MAG: phosphatidylserine/phosphatidylglycerophosphate/cardiolipin synthase family protein [Pirellulaceae bacterium]|nr:phosphatidylserine/phosphatidylglycerophosphate/cardiolipin synthase family protein [Pirellulaceae bacterium]